MSDDLYSDDPGVDGHLRGEVPEHMSLVDVLFITFWTDGRQFHQRMNVLDVKGVLRDVERRMDPRRIVLPLPPAVGDREGRCP